MQYIGFNIAINYNTLDIIDVLNKGEVNGKK